MKRLLIADAAWRQRKFMSFTGLSIAVLWWFWWTKVESADLLMPFGYSMGMAFQLGPQLAMRYMPRAIWYLPISRREAWRALWLFSTAGVTLLTTLAKATAMIAHRGPEPGGAARLMLSSVYDFTYSGIGCALVAIVMRPRPARGPRRQLAAAAAGCAEVAIPFGAVFGFAGIGQFRVGLPTYWSEFTPLAGLGLAAGLTVAISSYFHVPVPIRPVTSTASAGANHADRRPDRSPLTGLPRLLAHEYVLAMLVAGCLIAGSGAVVLIVAHVGSPSDVAAFVQMELGRIDGASLPAGEGADPFAVIVLVACFAAAIAARFPAMMRHLRALPIGTARLQTLLIAWPIAIWAHNWIVFIVLHYLLVGERVHSLHGAAFIGVSGISALIVAVSLRQSGPQQTFVFSSLLVAVPMLLFVGFPPAWMSAGGGIFGFVGAVALNRAALRRSSTYRHSGLPIAWPLIR